MRSSVRSFRLVPARTDARRNREGLGVSLDEIARRAGVGPGTVHRHFRSKEALYLAVATDLTREVAHLLDRVRHANVETNPERSAHLADLILDAQRRPRCP